MLASLHYFCTFLLHRLTIVHIYKLLTHLLLLALNIDAVVKLAIGMHSACKKVDDRVFYFGTPEWLHSISRRGNEEKHAI